MAYFMAAFFLFSPTVPEYEWLRAVVFAFALVCLVRDFQLYYRNT